MDNYSLLECGRRRQINNLYADDCGFRLPCVDTPFYRYSKSGLSFVDNDEFQGDVSILYFGIG